MLCMCCCWQGSGFSICCVTHLLGTGSPGKVLSVALANVPPLQVLERPQGDVQG